MSQAGRNESSPARQRDSETEENSMEANYIVLAVTLIIWVGLFFYLKKLDGNLKKLEDNA
jgi:CcmD family protein